MALHLSANGCYGVMIYNNRDCPDPVIEQELSKFGIIQELHKGGRNFVFVYYKHYEEARACLDELKDTPDFNAKPARPRETNRSESRSGARSRTRSSDNKDKQGNFSRFRSKSVSRINIDSEKNNGKDNIDEKISDQQDIINNNSNSNENNDETNKEKCVFRPRSKSVGRVDIENASRRADLIKKVIESEQKNKDPADCSKTESIGGSFDAFLDQVELLETQTQNPTALPCSTISKSVTGDCFIKDQEENKNFGGDMEKQPFIIPVKYFYDRQFSNTKKESHLVVIGGLPDYITEEQLCDLCTCFIPVLRIKMVEPRGIGEQLHAYIYVESGQNASILAKKMNKRLLFNNVIVAFTWTNKPKEF